MGVLITTSDFTGKYAIPTSASSDLESVINNIEEDILSDLLGQDLYALFKADLIAKVPQTPKYLSIYNAFRKDYGSKVYKSKGMKVMLLGFVWFEYMRNAKYKATVSGVVSNNPDASQQQNTGNLYQYLGEATDTYQAIQTYINYISTDSYSEYNGQCKEYSSPFFQ